MILRRDDPDARAVVPDHKQQRPGTLRKIINEPGSPGSSAGNCRGAE